jgi:Domain of unknown function (DUF929)
VNSSPEPSDGTPIPPRKGKKGSRPTPIGSSGKGTSGKGTSGKGNSGGRSGGASRSAQGSNRARSASAARQARQRRIRLGIIGIVAVVVVVALIVVLSVNSNNSAKPAPRVALTDSQSLALQSVPVNDLVAAFDKAGSGLNPATSLNAAPLTSGGKPEVLFIGAEFCPICATERWPLTVALSQFGKFTNLHQTRSAVHDGNIATVTYYGSSYTSQYLTFTPVETTTNVPKGGYYQLLQTPTAQQQALWSNTSQALGISEGFPFVYMGGKYVLTTAQFNPSTLEGKSFDEISGDVGNNDTSIGANIDASAAALTKYFCTMTGGKPGSVCNAVTNLNAPVSSSSSGSNTPANG